ncbi:MAG: ATP-dependent DNA helicase [Zoogloeaceae bacterium]|nr:ATP-dependent DNA helicase [Zoogloeaceae bacterium]
MLSSLSDIFSPAGPLADGVSGYRLRGQQLEMAEKVAAAIKENRVLVAEAGTGTGKTYAYLVPALMSGGKVIVSTGTKNLQDQLFNRDLPTIRAALNAPVTTALLKGRANYVCHYHLQRTVAEGRFIVREDAGHARAIARFAKVSRTGDKGECADVPESSSVWSMVTSTRDNCLGQDCPNHKECFVLAARREALAADIVVVNHHLFFADVMLKDEGMAELLPACNAVIFDEAHQLPETASLFFGENVSTAQVTDLSRDTKLEALASARDCLDLPPACANLEKAAKDLRLTLPVEPARFSLAQLEARAGFDNLLAGLINTLEHFSALLETQAERSEGLESCWQRSTELLAGLRRWRSGEAAGGKAEDGPGSVRWGEATTWSLQLNATPLAIGDIFRKQMSGHPRAWIFTSATLAVQKDFGHYCAEMGLIDAESACWESPFDYPSQAVLYVPQGLPEPNSPGFIEAVANAAFPVLKASGGRAFFLCTSLRAMRRTHELLKEKLEDAGLDYPLLLQGEGSKNELLERFRRLGNAVLVGSQSFWEGVDVRGEALSLVVIDKLPFAPPDDPVLSARIERMNREGRNAFMEYQLPRAVINVKQGAGRLIRDESDRGVLMICDPRLISKPYGKRVWRSLPPMKRTRELSEVVDFFAVEAVA